MLRLYIDSVQVPFDTSQRLSLSLSDQALTDLQSARTGTSLMLRIPSVPQTELIFRSGGDPHSLFSFNDTARTARLEYDGETIHEGAAVLTGTVCTGGLTHYLLRITDGAARWAQQAARTALSQLDIDFSMTLVPAQIVETWSGEQSVRMLPVVRDSYEQTYSSVGLQPAQRLFSPDECHPFVSVREMVRSIFAASGYTLRSRFMDGDFFRSLMMSGAYAYADTSAVRARMDFTAGRLTDAEAQADYSGRIYFSPFMQSASAGNIVDTFHTDDGRLYTRSGCMALEQGRTVFRPTAPVRAGFDYSLRYVTSYRIASRTRLTGFDTLYTPSTGAVTCQIANTFADRRDSLSPDFDYLAVVFGHTGAQSWRVVCDTPSGEHVMGSSASRSAKVSTPAAAWCSSPRLQCYRDGQWQLCQEDWALYDGYISESGQIEVLFTLRTPCQEYTPSSPATFDRLYMSGAEPGMSLRLLSATQLRPLFSAAAGHGSHLAFADIMHHTASCAELLQSLQQMFDLRICTDQTSREVFIEPAGDFYGGTVVDFTGRTVVTEPVTVRELSLEAHDRTVIGYRDDDGAVRRFNSAHDTVFGQWIADTGRYGSLEGDRIIRSPLFTPVLSVAGSNAGAPSALLMQVGDRDEVTGGEWHVSPRIVRWYGLQQLPAGENPGYPAVGGSYPLAAFHAPGPGDGTTLCYEDRDGLTGLHRFRDQSILRQRTARSVTLTLRLDAAEWSALRHPALRPVSLTSLFRLDAGGHRGLYILRSVEGYDPRRGCAECTFVQYDTAADS